jgi:hypothetical protein
MRLGMMMSYSGGFAQTVEELVEYEAAETLLDRHRAQLALYIGGMGAKGRNFSNDLVRRYGYEREAKLIRWPIWGSSSGVELGGLGSCSGLIPH